MKRGLGMLADPMIHLLGFAAIVAWIALSR